MVAARQPSAVEAEVLKDIAHQHHVLLDVESPIPTARRQIKDGTRSLLGRRHRHDGTGGVVDEPDEEVEVDVLLGGEAGDVDVVLAEVEGDDEGEEGLVVEGLLASAGDLGDLLHLLLVGLQHLRHEPLDLARLHLHLLGLGWGLGGGGLGPCAATRSIP